MADGIHWSGLANDWFSTEEPDARRALGELRDSEDIFIGSRERFFAAPAGITALARLYYANPEATLIAGSTDVGLWVTKQMRDLPKVIWLGRVKGLDEIEDRGDAISFGAMVTHTEAMPYLSAAGFLVLTLILARGYQDVDKGEVPETPISVA